MNISTGGPHILLFERDQQLTALLMSEFQLAGYECHAARTAVEVFDNIARYPIRLVLVNLAQAAAARREFWVALDTQRRGRGVQVLTFLCSNLASYGSQDGDERSHSMPVDLHIDGMLGLMSLVETIRKRLAGTDSITNTQPRVPRTNNAPTQSVAPRVSPQAIDQFPPVTPSSNSALSGGAYRNGKPPISDTQPVVRVNQATLSQPQAHSSTITHAPQAPASTPSSPSNAVGNTTQQSYTDKIRAVLYPNQHPTAVQPAAASSVQETTRPAYDAQAVSTTIRTTDAVTTGNSMLQQLANGQAYTEPSAPMPYESGLDQLSRLVQEHRSDTANGYSNGTPFATSSTVDTPQNMYSVQDVDTYNVQYQATTMPRPAPGEEPISTQTLRASPIQDLPLETPGEYRNRAESYASDTVHTSLVNQEPAQALVTPLASITTPLPKAPAMPTAHPGTSPMAPAQPRPTPTAPMPSVQVAATPSLADPVAAVASLTQPVIEHISADEDEGEPTGPLRSQADEVVEEITNIDTEEPATQLPAETSTASRQYTEPEVSATAANAVLLDIMQSLPPMSALSQMPQQQALQGHATRSLGSVLLEGHLVPQSRLEVAQNIQRMLRGVDLNYQLGEILLMFKLLTPDQLLAASLVSYGLITTQQIVALGRIRQELHAIGLEYDLENLLILFRILTPEQLREVRSNWQ